MKTKRIKLLLTIDESKKGAEDSFFFMEVLSESPKKISPSRCLTLLSLHPLVRTIDRSMQSLRSSTSLFSCQHIWIAVRLILVLVLFLLRLLLWPVVLVGGRSSERNPLEWLPYWQWSFLCLSLLFLLCHLLALVTVSSTSSWRLVKIWSSLKHCNSSWVNGKSRCF